MVIAVAALIAPVSVNFIGFTFLNGVKITEFRAFSTGDAGVCYGQAGLFKGHAAIGKTLTLQLMIPLFFCVIKVIAFSPGPIEHKNACPGIFLDVIDLSLIHI